MRGDASVSAMLRLPALGSVVDKAQTSLLVLSLSKAGPKPRGMDCFSFVSTTRKIEVVGMRLSERSRLGPYSSLRMRGMTNWGRSSFFRANPSSRPQSEGVAGSRQRYADE